MSEQFESPRSIYQNEAERNAAVAKLGRKITDVVKHKITGVSTNDAEYWGLKEVLTDEMVELGNKMKVRKFYEFEDLMKLEPTWSRSISRSSWTTCPSSASSSMTTATTTTTTALSRMHLARSAGGFRTSCQALPSSSIRRRTASTRTLPSLHSSSA